MAIIQRINCRCATCSRWWSLGPGDDPHCPCGGELVPVDMVAHIAALPDGTKATHNHPALGGDELKPRDQCPACDKEHARRDLARAEAKKAEQKPP